MKRLDPRFIDSFSKQASRLMKAIRCVQSLEDNLPKGFPEPTEIKLAKRPHDLALEWSASSPKHADALRNRISHSLQLEAKWHPDIEDGRKSIICRSRVRVGGKSTLNLHLRIQNMSGAGSGRGSGRRD
jgi:hypothetical protein